MSNSQIRYYANQIRNTVDIPSTGEKGHWNESDLHDFFKKPIPVTHFPNKSILTIYIDILVYDKEVKSKSIKMWVDGDHNLPTNENDKLLYSIHLVTTIHLSIENYGLFITSKVYPKTPFVDCVYKSGFTSKSSLKLDTLKSSIKLDTVKKVRNFHTSTRMLNKGKGKATNTDNNVNTNDIQLNSPLIRDGLRPMFGVRALYI